MKVLEIHPAFFTKMLRDYATLSGIALLSFLITLNLNVSGVRMQAWPNAELENDNSDKIIWPANYSGYCSNADCSIMCRNGDSKYLPADINASLNVILCNLTRIFLNISNYAFENKEIKKNWQPTSLQIFELHLISSDITVIQPDAFANESFMNLASLVLENLSIISLDSCAFNGLNNLKELIIIQEKTAISLISNDILIPMKYKIKTLKIRAGITTPKNVTCGMSLLSGLTKVDLSRNNFRHTIDSVTFCKLSNVETLDLSNSKIMSLTAHVFNSIANTIRFIDLSQNWLITLPPLLFQPLFPTTSVYLADNAWNCTCELQKVLATLKEITYATCTNPPEWEKWLISTINFCGSEEVPSGEVTDETSVDATSLSANNEQGTTSVGSGEIIATTLAPFQTMKLLCQVCDASDCSSDQLFYFERLRIMGKEADVTITLLTSTSVKVALATAVNIHYGLVWFSSATKYHHQMEMNYKDFGLGCHGGMVKPVIVDNLVPNKTYTFCIVRYGEELTSPFNCLSHNVSVGPVRKKNVWIYQENKSAVISWLIFGNIIAIVFGGCLFYCIVMRQPTLLRGSKRVVVIKKSFEDVMELTDTNVSAVSRIGSSSFKKTRPSLIRQYSSSSLESYLTPNWYETNATEKTVEVEESDVFYISKPIVPKRSFPLLLTPLDQSTRISSIDNIENDYLSNYYM